ncbi:MULTISPECIES: DoxX family protein [unclassified Nonomuraea]|uniref:DoxX family protein n=1 Tax=unclassified Nonomuraea TaxID=2593643 RepID=UPI00207BC924|nr:DoxX family protein [Nonomuraea sp. KC401]
MLLWAIQGTLAALFLVAGLRKSLQSKDSLAASMPALAGFSHTTIRFIAIAELAGAWGLVLPAATGIAPVLTPLAATGLAVIMALAALVHQRRREYRPNMLNVVLSLGAALVAGARFGPCTL